MGILTWLVLGLIAGLLAHALVGGGGGLLFDIVLGLVGAVVGGFIDSALGLGDVNGLNLACIVLATVGAIVVIVVVRALTRPAVYS